MYINEKLWILVGRGQTQGRILFIHWMIHKNYIEIGLFWRTMILTNHPRWIATGYRISKFTLNFFKYGT